MTTSGVEPGASRSTGLAAQVAGVRRPARPPAHRGHRVVQADARTDVRLLPLVLQRVEEVLVADQVRRERLDGQVAFAQRTEHQREVELLQVAQPAVHGLAGARGGADGEVAGLQQHHRQPAGGRVQGDAGTGDAAADHHQVVRPGGGGGDRVLARRRGERRSHFVVPLGGQRVAGVPERPGRLQQLHLVGEAGVVERAVRVVGLHDTLRAGPLLDVEVVAAGVGPGQHGAPRPHLGRAGEHQRHLEHVREHLHPVRRLAAAAGHHDPTAAPGRLEAVPRGVGQALAHRPHQVVAVGGQADAGDRPGRERVDERGALTRGRQVRQEVQTVRPGRAGAQQPLDRH